MNHVLHMSAGTASALFCFAASASCMERPSVLSEVRVDACQVVQFKDAVEVPFESGEVFASKEGAIGIVIRARTARSWIAWHKDATVRSLNKSDPKPKPRDLAQTYFVQDESKETCARIIGKLVKVATADICCDTLPSGGSCTVQLEQVILLNNPRDYRPANEKK